MKKRFLCLALLALTLSADISAAPRACVEKAGMPYTGSMPSNLRLLPVCPNAEAMYPGHIYWVFRGHITLTGETREEIKNCVAGSQLCVGLIGANDELIGFARVLTDFTFKALIFDVIVRKDHRKTGL